MVREDRLEVTVGVGSDIGPRASRRRQSPIPQPEASVPPVELEGQGGDLS